MKTAEDYIESVYGTGNFARTVELKDAQSLIDLMQDYGNYLVKEAKKSHSEKQVISDNWISVSERLPDTSINVLVSDIESGIVNIGWCHKSIGWHCDVAGVDVTHWMSLPKPPSGNR